MNKPEPKKEKLTITRTNTIPERSQPLALCLGVTARQDVDDGCEDWVELGGCLGAEDEWGLRVEAVQFGLQLG